MTDVHTESVTTCGWRLERWPTDRSIAHIVFTDMFSVPTVIDFQQAIAKASAAGFRSVRTSALFPRSQEVAIAAGLAPIDSLALFQLSINATDTDHAPKKRSRRSAESMTSRLRISQLMSAVEIDRLSFGDEWANSANSLRQIMNATEQARSRVVRDPAHPRSSIDGFIVSGITDTTGYIQRLAVHPQQRRRGVARALVADSLDWMRRHEVTSAFVNTGIENHAAQALYQSFGFVDTGEVLTINEQLVAHDHIIPGDLR